MNQDNTPPPYYEKWFEEVGLPKVAVFLAHHVGPKHGNNLAREDLETLLAHVFAAGQASALPVYVMKMPELSVDPDKLEETRELLIATMNKLRNTQAQAIPFDADISVLPMAQVETLDAKADETGQLRFYVNNTEVSYEIFQRAGIIAEQARLDTLRHCEIVLDRERPVTIVQIMEALWATFGPSRISMRPRPTQDTPMDAPGPEESS